MKKVIFVIVGVAVAAGVAIFFLRGGNPNSFRLEWRVGSSGKEFSTALQQTVGAPLRPGHRVEVLDNGKVFASLIAAISEARSSVNIEMYIWTKGAISAQVIAALKARRPGVQCRILLDGLGSISRGQEVDQGLADAKCALLIFRPGKKPLARNHRKVAVIDGRIGITGGFGVDDRWMGSASTPEEWRDTNVRVEGPAVGDMQESFAEDWQEAGGPFLPPEDFPEPQKAGSLNAAFVRSSSAPVVTRAERLTQLAIAAAHERLWIGNAYFVPGAAVLELLGRRAAEKVDVRILVPGKKSDSKLSFLWQQNEYGRLQKRGVKIWEYQRSMMHAKTMVIDGRISIVGSVNLDPLSLDRLEDAALVVEDEQIAKTLEGQFEADEKLSTYQD